MKEQAFRVIMDFVSEQIGRCNVDQQIQIYQAMAEVLPTSDERRSAREIAIQLSRAAALQQDFTQKLFRELQWPGHQHDGERGNGGKRKGGKE